MTYPPANLLAVRDYWVAHGGADGGVARGITGCAKASYHCGKDAITHYGRTAANDYSIRAPRDIAGLTNAAAAIDLSWPLVNKAGLRAFSNWLAAEIIAGAPDTLDYMEFVWSPDGSTVKVWSRIKAYSTASQSHTWHSHLGVGRDAIKAGKDLLGPFRRYFEPAVSPEVDVYPVTSYVPGHLATVADPTGPAHIRVAPAPTAAIIRSIPKGSSETWTVVGYVKGTFSAFGNSDEWLCRANNGVWEYTAKGNVRSVAAPVADCGPAVKAAVDPLNAQLAATQAALTTEQAKVAAAKAALG